MLSQSSGTFVSHAAFLYTRREPRPPLLHKCVCLNLSFTSFLVVFNSTYQAQLYALEQLKHDLAIYHQERAQAMPLVN